MPGAEVWPSGELEPRGFIVATTWGSPPGALGTAVQQARAHDLQLRQEGGDDIVPVEVLFAGDGAGHTSQALLRPSRPLRPGATYRLTLGPQEFRWRVSPAVEVPAPTWLGVPQVVGREYMGASCAESRLLLSAPVSGTGPLQVEVQTRRESSTEAYRAHVVAPEDGLLDLGRRFRNGSFDFRPGATYELRMWVLDTHGHRVALPAPVVVRAPGPEDPLPARLRVLLVERGHTDVWAVTWPYGLGLIGLALVLGAAIVASRRARP